MEGRRIKAFALAVVFAAAGFATGLACGRALPRDGAPAARDAVAAAGFGEQLPTDREIAERLESARIAGTVVRVSRDAIVLRMPDGKEKEFKVRPNIVVAVGPSFVNRKEDPPDLTRWFRPGDEAAVVAPEGFTDKEGKPVALVFRQLRPGEKAPSNWWEVREE